MAKVRFFLHTGANVHSVRKSDVLCTVKDLSLEDGEWESMSDSDKYLIAEQWAGNNIQIWYEEE